MALAFALALSLAAAPADGGVELEGTARVWLGPGVDSNPRRDYVSSGTSTPLDAYAYALGQLAGGLRVGDRLSLRGSYEVAGRAFLGAWAEDTVLQEAQLSARVAALDWLQLGLVGRARDRRGAGRDYTDLEGGVAVEVLPDAHLLVGLEVDAHRFLYWSRFAVSFWGPDTHLVARYRFDRHHSVGVSGQWSPRTFNATRLLPPPVPGGPPVPSTEARTDTVLGAAASYSYRGPFHVSVSYAYLDSASSSYGETLRRHRVGLTAGVALPWELTALAQGTLQLTQFPDGVYLSPELTVADDDENSSSVSAKLVRALGAHWEVDLRYAFYFNELPSNHFLYRRHVLSLGVAFSY